MLNQRREPFCTIVSITLTIMSVLSLNSCTSGTSTPGASESTTSVMEKFFDAEKKFDAHDYKGAEAELEDALAVLNTRPADERPDGLMSNHVNVHNYSIMTLELLAKCKYANHKIAELDRLTAQEERLLGTGYTGSFSKAPISGAKLYLNAFQAHGYLNAGNEKVADQCLEQCKDLQNLSDNTGSYIWLGDKGSPDFGRLVWLDARAKVLKKQGKSDPDSDREIWRLRTKLGIS